MKHLLLTIGISLVTLSSLTYANQNNPIIISPFIDLGYDVSPDYWDYNPYGYSTRNDANLSLGMNFYRKPVYVQFQLANYLNGFTNNGDYFGIAKLGMAEPITKNGYIEMNFTYTDNLTQSYDDYDYHSYAGSIGYYHLFMPPDTSNTNCFSGGISLGFVNHNYLDYYWGWMPQIPYERNYTNFFTILEFAWLTKHLRPYIAFGMVNVSDDYYYPRNSSFFSIGIQAHLTNIVPYFSGNQTKLTYYKQHRNLIIWEPVIPRKPNIYLYPETKTKVKVSLSSQKGNYITTSLPDYNNGWNVWVEPSGKIDNKYDYLFYEGSEIKYQPGQYGWSVSHSDLWQFLPIKMFEYGFNEQEIKDFVDYWQEHLPKSDYYDIIPLVNQEIENEFSLAIEPKPDAILRVWFYINPTDSKKDMPAPLIQKFERKGFSVVEWGVLLK